MSHLPCYSFCFPSSSLCIPHFIVLTWYPTPHAPSKGWFSPLSIFLLPYCVPMCCTSFSMVCSLYLILCSTCHPQFSFSSCHSLFWCFILPALHCISHAPFKGDLLYLLFPHSVQFPYAFSNLQFFSAPPTPFTMFSHFPFSSRHALFHIPNNLYIFFSLYITFHFPCSILLSLYKVFIFHTSFPTLYLQILSSIYHVIPFLTILLTPYFTLYCA